MKWIVASALIAGCGARHPAPTASGAAPEAPVVANQAGADPARHQELLATIRAQIQAHGVPTQALYAADGGRLVRTDTDESYQEDFLAADVTSVVYEYNPSWPRPHLVKVLLREGSVTRFRRGDEPWNDSSIMDVTFVFADQRAADVVVQAMAELVEELR